MLKFPWNKKAKNLNEKKAVQTQGEGKPERVPYTLDEVDDLIQKYNARGKEASLRKKAGRTNGKASFDATKEKLTVKRQPDWRPVSKAEKQAESNRAAETITAKTEIAQQEKPLNDPTETIVPEQDTSDEKVVGTQVWENEVAEAEPVAEPDSVKPEQVTEESPDESVASTGEAVKEQAVDEQIKEKIENGEHIVFFEGEETEPEWDVIEEHHPQLEALAEWVKNKLFESLWGLFISDLNGEKIYARYGFQNTDLKNLLLIPPVVDAELQNDLQQGKVRESLFRTERNKMLYYMEFSDFRIALFLDEEKLNMGMLFSIVKPAIEARIKEIAPID